MDAFLPPLYVKIPVRLLLLDISDSYKMTAVKLWALTWKSHIHSTPEVDVNWLKAYLNLGRTQYFGHMAALHASGVLSWTRVGRGRLIVTFADWLDCKSNAGDPQTIGLGDNALTMPAPPDHADGPGDGEAGHEESVLADSPGRRLNVNFNTKKPPVFPDSLRAESVRNPGLIPGRSGKADGKKTPQDPAQTGRLPWEQALSAEIVSELRSTGVYEALFQKVADSGWTEWQIHTVLEDVKRKSTTPGALFAFRLAQTKPPLEPGSDNDRQKYVSGPFAEFVRH